MAEFKLGRLRFVWKSTWTTSTTYVKDDIVKYGGTTYVCMLGHSATDFQTDLTAGNWQVMSSGQEWKSNPWTTSTVYKTNDLVKYGGNVYICTANHTSSATASGGFYTDEAANRWDLFTSGTDWKGIWLPETYYKENDLVKYNGLTYICRTAHTSAITAYAGESIDSITIVDNGSGYTNGADLIFSAPDLPGGTMPVGTVTVNGFGSITGINLTVNGSGYTQVPTIDVDGAGSGAALLAILTSSFVNGLEVDGAKWNIFSEGFKWRGDWNGSQDPLSRVATAYAVNDIVKFGAGLYLCVVPHTSNSSTFQESKWTVFVQGLEFEDNWSGIVEYQIGDIVTYGGYAYTAIARNTGQIPPTATGFWKLLTTGFNNRAEYSDVQTYKVGDLIRYGGNTYVAVEEVSANETPYNTPAKWEKITDGFRWRSDWDSAPAEATYKIGDIAKYRASTYICINEHYPSDEGTELVVTNTNGVSEEITISGSTGLLNVDQPVVFSGTAFGNIVSGTTYYVKAITGSTKFKISQTQGGSTFNLDTASGTMVVTFTSRPDLDDGTFWNSFAEGDANNVLVRRGDLVTRNAIQNVRLVKGEAGTFLKAGAQDLTWSKVGNITQVFYVSTDGSDSNDGTTLNSSWRTIKHACDYVRTTVVPTVNAPAVINVKTGVYTEVFPISIPKFTSLVGDELRMSIVQPTTETSGNDKFYMRDSTTIRNFTFRGATGANLADGTTDTYTTANQYGTQRPTGGAWVSLDPGTGPNDESVWVGARSPYVQNVSTFGEYCVGQKIDGALHNGGNKSITSNDFTQLLSNSIGAWCTNQGRAELVSVFTYYCYIGYLCEAGGVIRATNGNNSYGTYGSVSEGVDPTEISRTSSVDNRRFQALIDRVQTDGADKVLYVEYLNAGEEYTTATFGFSGSGTFNSVVSTPVIQDGGIAEIQVLDTGENYTSVTNNAQAGTNIDIRLGAADIALSNAYNGQRILLIDGTGAGQYAYITSFDGGTKLATLGMESFTPLEVSKVTTGTNRLTVPDTSTLSVDMPFTLTGTAFGTLATATQYYVKALVGTSTLASVSITGNAGQFSCTSTTLLVNQTVTITGTAGGTGGITGYTSGNVYYIIATNGTTTFTLSATKGGPAITTSLGTPTGLTYTLSGSQFTVYTDTVTKAAVTFATTVTGSMLLHKSGWDTVITGITETISAATKANPVQITTSVPHAYFTGMQVTITGVTGMTQLNGNTYFVTKTGDSTFTLYSDWELTTTVDGTGYSTYISGGTAVGKQYVPLFLNTTSRYVVEPRAVIQTGSGATATAVQTPGVNTISVVTGGGGFTVPPEVIVSGNGTATGGSGTVATSTIEGEVDAIVIQARGSGYTSAPTLTFVGGGLPNGSVDHATATATITNSIKTVEVTNGGSGYTTPPSVTATGTGGSGAIISAQISNVVGSVTLTGGSNSKGSGYTSTPTVTFSGGEPLVFAEGTAVLSASVTTITVQEGGSGYAPYPATTVLISSVTGSNATAQVVVDGGNYVAGVTPGIITGITVLTNGSGYATPPTVTIVGDGVDASATANISGIVNSITITNPGRGYQTTPTVTISGGGGTGAQGTVVLTGSVISLTVVDGGRGWVGTPALSFSGGGGSNADADVTAMDSVLDTVTLDTPGTGYTSNPAISVTGGKFTYNAVKCSRDVGLILDAVLADMVFNSNYQSVKAGISYLRSYTSVVLADQKAQTLGAIVETRDELLSYTTDAAAISRITARFAEIYDIIDGGLPNVPVLSYPAPANTVIGIIQAAEILQANRAFIQAEITAWIDVQVTGGAGIWSGFTYDSAACEKDVGYIVDALTFDLLYGGNSQTIDVAKAYYNGAAIVAEGPQSVAAYGYLKTILDDIVQNTAITPSAGNTEIQDTSITPAGTATQGTTLQDLTDILIDIVDNGVAVAPTVIAPTYSNGNTSLATLRSTLLTYKSAIQSGVIQWINTTYITSSAILRARIDGIVQTVTVSDPGGSHLVNPEITFANGNNYKSAVAGDRYYRNASALVAIGLEQQTQTLAGIDRLRVVARAVAQNQAPASLYQTAIARTTGTAGPTGIENAVDVWANAVYYTIQNGENYANAKALILANRAFLRKEVETFWADNYPGIADAVWSRDAGLLIDAIAEDMGSRGVAYTLNAGINLIFQGTARTTNLATAVGGIEFIRDLVIDIVQNIIVTSLNSLTITASSSGLNEFTTSSTTTLSAGDAIRFTGTPFGGITANTTYYVYAVTGAATFQIATTADATTALALTSGTGTMTLTKQYIDDALTLETGILTTVPNLFNYAVDIISTDVADSSTFAITASLLDSNKQFIKAEVIAYINTTFADFDYNQQLCARDVGLIVDAIAYDLRYALDNQPVVTPALTGVVSGITVNTAGVGYGDGTTVTISGGGSPTVTAVATPVINSLTGAITGFTMTNKGRGYSSTPTVTVIPDGGSGAFVRAKIVGGAVNVITVIHPGSGYTAAPNITLVDANNTADGSFRIKIADGVLDQPRFTSRGVGFTTADALVDGDGFSDIAQVGQYVYVNNLTNIPTPGANIQFSTDPSAYYKLVTVREVTGPSGIIGARQLITDNKEFIQYEIISYLNNFSYDSVKCSRDVGLIIDALADDYTYEGNARLQAILYQHQRGTFELFEQQRMQTAFALEYLQELINNLYSETLQSSFGVAVKLDFLIEWIKNAEYNTALPALSMPNGGLDTQDDRAKNVLLANETFITTQVIRWMINNSKISGFNQAIMTKEIRQMVRSIAYDLTYTGNSQTVEFASSYYIDSVLTIPGVPGSSSSAKANFLETITYLGTILSDIAVNNNVTPESGNTVSQNTGLTPGDSASQGRISTLSSNMYAIVNNGFSASGVSLTNSSFSGFSTTKRTVLLANKSTFQTNVINWITDNFVNFTYDQDMCFRDTGLIVQAVADDIFGDVAKSVEAGQRYYAATAALVLSDQKPQTIAAIAQINFILQMVIRNETYTRTQTNAFQTRYPTITNGDEASEQVELTTRIVRSIIERGTILDDVKQLLLDNKEFIKAEVVAYVSASYENLNYNIDLCARDVGLIIDAIAYDIYGGLSRSREAGLRYYQSASSLLAIGGEDHTGEQYGPTVAAMAFLNDVLLAVLADLDPDVRFQEAVSRVSPDPDLVFYASRLLIPESVTTFIDTILEVINNGPSVLPPGRYSARLQLSPALTVATAPAHDTAMVIRSRYSQVRLTGHDFLNIGTGSKNDTNYPGIPLNAPNANRELTEQGGGRVFYTSTDQDGNFRVGTLFKVEQSTGIATLNADAFNLSGLNELTLGGVNLGGTGATINEFSTDGTFFANSDRIVPTQKAIKTYIQSALGSGGGNIAVNAVTAGDVFITGKEIDTVGGGLLSILSDDGVFIDSTVSSVSTVTGALTVAGGVGIIENLNVGANATIEGAIIVNGAGYIKVATGTTAERPLAPATGMIRYNTTNSQFEGYLGTQWAELGGGGRPWVAKTTTYTAVASDRIIVNTAGAAFTINLPATPVIGDTVKFIDGAGTFHINNLTIGRNGSNIMGDSANMTVSTQNAAFTLVYYNTTYGWRLGDA